MITLLQSEVEQINKQIKNPKYIKCSQPKNSGGKTYMLTNDSPLISFLAQLRGYEDKKINVNGVDRIIKKEQQCLDEDIYAVVQSKY